MNSTLVRAVQQCRVCLGTDLRPFLDLGEQPPANALLTEEGLRTVEQKFPLALCYCASCELIQLTHVVAASTLFEHYVYFSSVSAKMAEHFAALADEVATRFVPKNGLCVELGSNDGILLRSLLGRELRVLGVDPASTVGDAAREQGVPTVTDYFCERVAREIRDEHGPASAMFANNVFAHIDDLHDVMRGVRHLLADDGVFEIEAPYVLDFLEHLEFDTVYHEHLSYLGVKPLCRLFEQFGLEVFEVSRQPVHGGTVRVFGRKQRAGNPPVHPSVAALIALEDQENIGPARLARFANDVRALRESLISTVRELKAAGKRVVGYTAPAKGMVLLNYCGLGPDDVEYLADATPAKQGRYACGVRIPIKSPEHFRQDNADYALLLAWNHKAEILAKEAAFRARGGHFIVPVPKVTIA